MSAGFRVAAARTMRGGGTAAEAAWRTGRIRLASNPDCSAVQSGLSAGFPITDGAGQPKARSRPAFGEREAVPAGDIGAELEAEGIPVGTEDALIAATAMAHGLVVATRNTSHVSRVKTLRVINGWP